MSTNKPIKSSNPGNRCTMDLAKQLGIQEHNLKLMNIRKFNDNDTDDDYNTLCYQSKLDSKKFFKNCTLEHGVGYIRKPGEPNKCITVECPPGFTYDSSNDRCKKDIKKAVILKKSECSERLHDWFTIPNYHLGNKYQKYEDKCMASCKNNFVPNYTEDPVDGFSLNIFNSISNVPIKCITKSSYFAGKYNDTPDYCPLAIIKNLTSTKQKIKDEIVKELPEGVLPDETNEDVANSIIDDISKNKMKVIGQKTLINQKGPILEACKNSNTNDRLAEAYHTCENLLNSDKQGKVNQFIRELGDDNKTANLRYDALERACHAQFCNINDTSNELVKGIEYPKNSGNILKGLPLCFKNIKDAEDLSNEAELIVSDEDNKKENEEINSNKELGRVLTFSKISMSIIILPMVIVTLYGLYRTFGSKVIALAKKIWEIIWIYFINYPRKWITGYSDTIELYKSRSSIRKDESVLKNLDSSISKLTNKLKALETKLPINK